MQCGRSLFLGAKHRERGTTAARLQLVAATRRPAAGGSAQRLSSPALVAIGCVIYKELIMNQI